MLFIAQTQMSNVFVVSGSSILENFPKIFLNSVILKEEKQIRKQKINTGLKFTVVVTPSRMGQLHGVKSLNWAVNLQQQGPVFLEETTTK